MMLRFGIIGCGAIAHAHAAAIAALPDATLAACCDCDVVKGRAFAKAAGAVAFYSDYHELLASNLDVVTIATPHFLHATMSIAALQAGKAVLCEKPLAMTPAEGRAVLAVAAKFPGNNRAFRARPVVSPFLAPPILRWHSFDPFQIILAHRAPLWRISR